MRSQVFYGNPGQHKEAEIVDHMGEIFTPLGIIPTDKLVSAFDPPCRRAPSQAGYGPIFKIGQVFEFRAYQKSVSLIVVFMDQPVPEGFLRGPGNYFELERAQIVELSRYRGGRDGYPGFADLDRSFGVVVIITNTGRKFYKRILFQLKE